MRKKNRGGRWKRGNEGSIPSQTFQAVTPKIYIFIFISGDPHPGMLLEL